MADPKVQPIFAKKPGIFVKNDRFTRISKNDRYRFRGWNSMIHSDLAYAA